MATRAIKPKRDDTMLTGWQSVPERAPSVMREDRPTVVRFLAMVGLLLTAIGGLAMFISWMNSHRPPDQRIGYLVNANGGGFCFSMGVALLLFHAFADRDISFRRSYAALALVLTMVGLALRVLPFGGRLGGFFLPLSIPALSLSLLLFLGVLRNEIEKSWRSLLLTTVGSLGILLTLAGLIAGQFTGMEHLVAESILLLALGLGYVSVFTSFQENEETSYRTSLGVGAIGLISFVVALVRSLLPDSQFFLPNGFALMGFGLLYMGISLGMVSDRPLIVLIRRELASFFYSPIAYLVLLGMLVIGWLNFVSFVSLIMRFSRQGVPFFEPIVSQFIINIILVIALMVLVPVLTMRLLSEEKRSGTLEVLLTAPVNEITVVLSKFFAALIFYVLTWVPWWLFLVALWIIGGQDFDYRPLLTFNLALLTTGTGFLAMGLFFSSITRNQIIAAVLAFVGMMAFLAMYLLKFFLNIPMDSAWFDLLNYMSFLDLWFVSLEGQLAPRLLVFHVSVTIFFLFLTVKVLESRRWK